MFYYYFDRYYWILIVPAMLFAMWAQTKVNSTLQPIQPGVQRKRHERRAGLPADFG